MATAPATPSPTPTAAWLPATVIAQRMRNAAWAFLWGGAMCLILALWLGTNFDDLPRMIPLFTGLLGAAGISVAALQFWLAWNNQTDPWLAKRPMLGWMALASGVALEILAVLLISWYGASAIGEGIGAAVFGILALLEGLTLVNPLLPDTANPYLDALFRNWMIYRNVLIGVGVILLVLFFALVFHWKIGMTWFPEIAATLLLSLVALIGALWLSTSHGKLTPALLRMLILVQGGIAGLIITLATAVRVYLWRKDMFLDGISGWQGANGWQVWVCGYAGIFGLTLMFVSLLLAKADIRNQPTLRRALFGYNALVTSLLVILTLVLVNIVSYAMFPYTFNWSQGRGLHTLAPSTKNLLNNIKVPTTIYVTVSERSRVYTDLRQVLNNCQAQTNQLQVKYISPDKDVDEFRVLRANFPQYFQGKLDLERLGDEDSGRGILIVKGAHELQPVIRGKQDAGVKVPSSFIAERKLGEIRRPTEEDPRPKEIFNGEGELAKELAFLDENKQKRKLFFLQGQDELDINSMSRQPRGFGEPMRRFGANVLVDKLKKENYDVIGLSFAKELPKGEKFTHQVILAQEGPDKKKQIPEDCHALVIAGMSTTIPPETLEALERFLDRGGKLLVCLQSLTDGKSNALFNPGLDVLLKKYGIKSADEMAIRIPIAPRDTPFRSFATPADTKNVFAQQFLPYQIPFYTPMVVRPDTNSRKFKAEPLFVLDPRRKIVELLNTQQKLLVVTSFELPKFAPDAASFATEPLPVVVGVTEEPDKGDPKPRMVIFGDSEFISNSQMIDSFGDPAGKPYYDLFASALDWLAERPSVGVRPKESNYFIMKKDVEYGRMYWWPFWLMLLGIAGLGGGMWIVRRR